MMTVDTTRLWKMLEELEPKRRVQALRGGFRKAANEVKKTARARMRQKVNSSPALEKQIRGVLYKRTAGFRVTIMPKKKGKKVTDKFGNTRIRQVMSDKPTALWLEGGTKARQTSTAKRWGRMWFDRKRKGHNTGKVAPREFMKQTKAEVTPKVTESLRESIESSIEKIAKKYGCS